MKIQILICTSNEKIFNLVSKLPPENEHIKYLISHQIFDGKKYDINFDRHDVKYIPLYSKGVSKNRNNTLKLATEKICLIADDDEKFNIENILKIIDIYEKNPRRDIITFKIRTDQNRIFKNYSNKAFKHNIITILDVSSLEISFRFNKIKNFGLNFDTNFGIGSIFSGGEENIFLSDAYNKGLNIYYEPIFIAEHPFERTGTINRFNAKKVRTYGAKNYRIFGVFGFLLNILFSIKSYKDYKTEISFLKYLRLIFQGSIMEFRIENRIKIPINLIFSIFKIIFFKTESVAGG